MRDVYVAGIGITTFTRLEYALSEIASYASMMALKDAGVTEVDDVYVANMGGARVNHQTALASALMPATRGRIRPPSRRIAYITSGTP